MSWKSLEICWAGFVDTLLEDFQGYPVLTFLWSVRLLCDRSTSSLVTPVLTHLPPQPPPCRRFLQWTQFLRLPDWRKFNSRWYNSSQHSPAWTPRGQRGTAAEHVSSCLHLIHLVMAKFHYADFLRDVRDKPVTSPLAQIPLRRLPRNFPVWWSFGEVSIMEFGLKGTSQVCCGCHLEVGIVEIGLYSLMQLVDGHHTVRCSCKLIL